MNKGIQSNPIRALAERLRSDPEAARKLFVQAGIYTEEGNLREAFGGTMNKEKPMNKRFDIEAAKRGEPILYDGEPATFVAYLPDNEPAHRVILSWSGQVQAFTKDGRLYLDGAVRLTMAPSKEKTVGYRAYYAHWLGKVVRACLIDGIPSTPESVERQKGFIRWIHPEWQYDEVEL